VRFRLKGFDERNQDLSLYFCLFYDGDAHASLSLHDRGRWVEAFVVISCSESGRESNQFFCGVDLDFLRHNVACPRNSRVALQ
jgi:hypothetical protein